MLLAIIAIEDQRYRELILALYQRYSKALLLYANNLLNNRAEAEDVVQAAFAKLIARPELLKFDTPEENKAYLMAMAHNMAANVLRARDRETPWQEEAGPLPGGDSVEQTVILQESYALAASLVNQLPEMYRDAIFLRYGKGLSDGEIGDILGVTPNNVRVRIHRGLKMARAASRRGGACHD